MRKNTTYDKDDHLFRAALGGPFTCPICYKEVKTAKHKPCWSKTISQMEEETKELLEKSPELASLFWSRLSGVFSFPSVPQILIAKCPTLSQYHILVDIAFAVRGYLENRIPKIEPKEDYKFIFHPQERSKDIQESIMDFYKKNQHHISLLNKTYQLIEQNPRFQPSCMDKIRYRSTTFLLNSMFSIMPKEKLAEMMNANYSSLSSKQHLQERLNSLIATIYKNINQKRYLEYNICKNADKIVIEDTRSNKKYPVDMNFIICDVCLKCLGSGGIYMCWYKLGKTKGRSIKRESEICLREIQNPITDETKFPRIIFCKDCFDMASNQLYFTLAGVIKILNEAFSAK